MADRVFFDSNILLYSLQVGDHRCTKARLLIDVGGVISVQVLNEFINAAWKKLRFPYLKSAEHLLAITSTCDVVSVTPATQKLALEIAVTKNIGIYDANIVAAAELAGCDVLYTEDLSHGQKIGRVSIVNPFK